ncbi:hypothetical protein D1094_18460 [Colwellia sp. RSH04]|nr:hypothetical protein D1094_18460 [Colwellia sp. RSH04]
MLYHHVLEKVFFYIVLFLMILLVVLCPFAVSYFAINYAEGINLNLSVSFGLLALILLSWFYCIRLIYFGFLITKTINAVINYDDNGITIKQKHGSRLIKWSELVRFKEKIDLNGLMLLDKSDKVLFIISLNSIGFNLFKAELDRRLNCT